MKDERKDIIYVLLMLMFSFVKIGNIAPFSMALLYATYVKRKLAPLILIEYVALSLFPFSTFSFVLQTVAILPLAVNVITESLLGRKAKTDDEERTTQNRLFSSANENTERGKERANTGNGSKNKSGFDGKVELKSRDKTVFFSIFFHFALSVVSTVKILEPIEICVCFLTVISFSIIYVAVVGKPLRPHFGKVGIIEYAQFLFIASVGYASESIKIAEVGISYLIIGFFAFYIGYLCNKNTAFSYAFVFSVGTAIASQEIGYVILFPLTSLVECAFMKSKRIFPIMASVMTMMVICVFITRQTENIALKLLFFTLGKLIFALIPRKVLIPLKEENVASGSAQAVKYLINYNKYSLCDSVEKLENIFYRMGQSLSTSVPDGKTVSKTLAKTIENEVCMGCVKYKDCLKNRLSELLQNVASVTLVKNKATISSLPAYIENECIHLAALVGFAYDKSVSLRKQMIEINTKNKIRASLSETFMGMGGILQALKINMGEKSGFDEKTEDKIKEKFAFYGIACYQVFVILGVKFTVMALVDAKTYDKQNAEKAVSTACQIDCIENTVDDSVIKGYMVVTFVEEPRYYAVSGVSTVSKTHGASGDTHSFVSLGGGKIMCAVCDGMGSGEQASLISEKAIAMVEDFYRAGFEHALTIKNVNTFLSLCDGEKFSALDILVFDKYEGRADVVKLASPPCYVKKKDRVVRIDSSSLPLGIVGEIAPSVSSRQVEDGDVFIFVTDGVSDCFSGDTLSGFINKIDSISPKFIAERILIEAKNKSGSIIKDDMTVVTCGVFYK